MGRSKPPKSPERAQATDAPAGESLVFISWSGVVSGRVATALRDWLPNVLQAARPWMSKADIRSGTVWQNEISAALRDAIFGIVCLEPSTLEAPWLLFEAGALFKGLPTARVCPYLRGLEATAVAQPLGAFNSRAADRSGTWELVKDINVALEQRGIEEDRLKLAFEKWYPDLEKSIKQAEDEQAAPAAAPSQAAMLGEILSSVRQLGADVRDLQRAVGHSSPWDRLGVVGVPPTAVADGPFTFAPVSSPLRHVTSLGAPEEQGKVELRLRALKPGRNK